MAFTLVSYATGHYGYTLWHCEEKEGIGVGVIYALQAILLYTYICILGACLAER